MPDIKPELHVFDNASLLPSAWAAPDGGNGIALNPAIADFQGQLLMAYRVVTLDGRRRLAICRLTPECHVVPGSVVPLSDSIRDGGDWHADARFCTMGGRLFVHYNDGWQGSGNHIFLVEIDRDTLQAAGPARQLVLDGPRQTVEKNWMLFEHDGQLWVIYSISPHVVLKVELVDQQTALCRPVYCQEWDARAYTVRYGPLRGGAPPVQGEKCYISIFHSLFPVRPLRRLLFRLLRRRSTATLRYVAGVYAFEAQPPFAPQWLHPEPLIQPPPLPRRFTPQLDSRIERCAYPCGSVHRDGQWFISIGVQNEYCCIAVVADKALPTFPVSDQGGNT